MPFLGKSPSDGNHNVLLDAITTSATATYNLTKNSIAYTPVSAQSLMVSLNGVTQAPIAAYTVSGSTIVFASALTSNDVIDYIIAFEGPKVNATLDDNTVTTAMIQDNAITSAKIGVDVIVAEDLAANSITVSEITDDAVTQAKIADEAVDEARLQISNAGTNGQFLSKQSGNTGGLTWADAGITGITSSADATAMTIDSSERIVMPSQPMFYAHTIHGTNGTSGGSLASASSYVYNDSGNTSGTIGAVRFANVMINIGSHWDNDTGQFTCPIAGRYLAFVNFNYHDSNNWPNSYIMHSINGGNIEPRAHCWLSHTEVTSQFVPMIAVALINAAASDKIWPGYHTSYNAPKTTTTWGYNHCGIMLLG